MARQARAIQTRQAILLAAAAVFDERGYGSATVNEIVERARVTKGALYFHFTSKEDLALGVIQSPLELIPAEPQLTRVQELVDQGVLLAHLLKHDPLVRAGVGLSMQSWREGFNRVTPFRSWIERLGAILLAAQQQGELLRHVRPEETAELLAGSFTGIQEMSHVLCERDDLHRRVEVLLRHVLPSIALPALLPTIDFGSDRAVRLIQQRQSERAAEGETNWEAGEEESGVPAG